MKNLPFTVDGIIAMSSGSITGTTPSSGIPSICSKSSVVLMEFQELRAKMPSLPHQVNPTRSIRIFCAIFGLTVKVWLCPIDKRIFVCTHELRQVDLGQSRIQVIEVVSFRVASARTPTQLFFIDVLHLFLVNHLGI